MVSTEREKLVCKGDSVTPPTGHSVRLRRGERPMKRAENEKSTGEVYLVRENLRETGRTTKRSCPNTFRGPTEREDVHRGRVGVLGETVGIVVVSGSHLRLESCPRERGSGCVQGRGMCRRFEVPSPGRGQVILEVWLKSVRKEEEPGLRFPLVRLDRTGPSSNVTLSLMVSLKEVFGGRFRGDERCRRYFLFPSLRFIC